MFGRKKSVDGLISSYILAQQCSETRMRQEVGIFGFIWGRARGYQPRARNETSLAPEYTHPLSCDNCSPASPGVTNASVQSQAKRERQPFDGYRHKEYRDKEAVPGQVCRQYCWDNDLFLKGSAETCMRTYKTGLVHTSP